MALPNAQGAFLWGARKTGKSTYLKHTFPEATYIDLLHTDLYLRYLKRPALLREEILGLDSNKNSQTIIIDEIQKIPALLDEVHWLMENTPHTYILCGSSARKLRRQGINLLGGRAWKYGFFPLVYPELPHFDLKSIFNNGLLPSHYCKSQAKRSLKAYLEDYIKLEIQEEGLVRNLPAFARFMDALSFSLGEMVNYTSIAREVGIDAKTVREYYHILEDTLLGYFVLPYKKHVARAIISETPKFYLFDVGVANNLKKVTIEAIKGAEASKALENYVMTELTAYKGLNDRAFEITYWRTKSGLEVDFVLENETGEIIALEVKLSSQIDRRDVKGLMAFCEEHNPKAAYVVSIEPRVRKIQLGDQVVSILPIERFLEKLWQGDII